MKRKLTVKKYSLMLAGEYAAFGAGAVILLVFIASTLDSSLLQSGQQAAVVTSVLTDLVNTDRELNHVPDLRVNPTLTAIAQAKANDMAAKSYFSHTSPDGHDPWYWFKQGGYAYTYAGENLAVDFSDSADVEQAWMNSPTHRANLLNQHYTEIGIATAVGTYQGHRTVFVAQEFGTPVHSTALAAAPIVTPSTATPTTKTVTATTKPKLVTTTKPIQRTATTTSVPAQTVGSSTPVAVLGSATETLPTASTDTSNSFTLQTFWNIFAASPRTTLKYAYYLFTMLILSAIVLETGMEVRRRHMKHVAIALALMVLMGTLFFAADSFLFSEPILVERGAAAGGA